MQYLRWLWSEMGDSNSRHLAPKASALPTALIPDFWLLSFAPDVVKHVVRRFFLTTSTCGGSACIAGVSRDCGHSVFRLEGGATRSQTRRATNFAIPGYYRYLNRASIRSPIIIPPALRGCKGYLRCAERFSASLGRVPFIASCS